MLSRLFENVVKVIRKIGVVLKIYIKSVLPYSSKDNITDTHRVHYCPSKPKNVAYWIWQIIFVSLWIFYNDQIQIPSQFLICDSYRL